MMNSRSAMLATVMAIAQMEGAFEPLARASSTTPARVRTPERLTKAEKKRARKNAQRAHLAAAKNNGLTQSTDTSEKPT